MKYNISFDLELRENPYKGLYIALEGIDGCGKTTQIERLARYFESKGKKVVVTREPRKKGIIGDMVQKILLGNLKFPQIAFQNLFATDRFLNQAEVVEPTIKNRKILISDRCFWSAVVYGILDKTKNKYDLKEAEQLLVAQSILSMYHQFIVPDYTFYLRISIPTSMKRLGSKNDTKEIYEDKQKIKGAMLGYEWLAEKFKNKFIIIDGEKPIDEVTGEMINKIKL